jgi:hypothetical protein
LDVDGTRHGRGKRRRRIKNAVKEYHELYRTGPTSGHLEGAGGRMEEHVRNLPIKHDVMKNRLPSSNEFQASVGASGGFSWYD